MLERLIVHNYVLIDSLDISFSDGFSVLTGETGSGKTIMLGAISLLLGAKADREAIRRGFDSAEVTGLFRVVSPSVLAWLDDKGVEIEDGELLIRRIIKASGRSSYTVNGSPITRIEGRELGELLVDVSSQHAQQSLMRPNVMRELLDEASGNSLCAYHKLYQEMLEAEEKVREIEEMIQKGSEQADYMRFALSELEGAGLREGEEEELRERIRVMDSSEFLRASISSVMDELRSASSSLSDSLSTLRKAEKKDSSLSDLSERMENIDIECSDIILTLRDHLAGRDFSEEDLESANARLSVIQRVKKRYGGTVEEAMRRRDEYRERLRVSDDGEVLLADARLSLGKARQSVSAEAARLSESRKRGAKKLERSVEERLRRLGMESAVFTILVERGSDPGPDGMDDISFMIAPNKGERLSPIQNSASGGELSRIMLALKSSISGGGNVGTLLFDEIDAGIGGAVASAVADELKALSSSRQVIAITHLPQLAVKASRHFLVYKEEMGGRTISHIREIEGEDRVREIARLLSGETSDISLEHAAALLEVQ